MKKNNKRSAARRQPLEVVDEDSSIGSTQESVIAPTERTPKRNRQRELVDAILDAPQLPDPTIAATPTTQINVVSTASRLTTDNVNQAGARLFRSFINGASHITVAERNTFIDEGARFILTFMFGVPTSEWLEFSHEKFFQSLFAVLKESSTEILEDELRKLVIDLDLRGGRGSLQTLLPKLYELFQRHPPDNAEHEQLLVNILLDKFKKRRTKRSGLPRQNRQTKNSSRLLRPIWKGFEAFF
jgi:hypothetical protein